MLGGCDKFPLHIQRPAAAAAAAAAAPAAATAKGLPPREGDSESKRRRSAHRQGAGTARACPGWSGPARAGPG